MFQEKCFYNKTMHRKARVQGFTFVELAIVLVIIGLLTGGVLVGQSLIQQSELRLVTREYQSFQTAISTFKDTYFGLPGDLPDATRYWGTNAGGCTAAITDTTTCNGNANGQINLAEAWTFWQQLASAGFISGRYSAYKGPQSTEHAVIGTNVPLSRVRSAGWTALYGGDYTDIDGIAALFSSATSQNLLIFGAATAKQPTIGPILKPEDAYNIDVKLDDGLPNTGKVTTPSNTASCASATAYVLTTSTASCGLLLEMGQ